MCKMSLIIFSLVPPEWLIRPSDKEILSGDTVLLSCSATGKPKPSITWTKLNGNN